jgi:hypothetical protein
MSALQEEKELFPDPPTLQMLLDRVAQIDKSKTDIPDWRSELDVIVARVGG